MRSYADAAGYQNLTKTYVPTTNRIEIKISDFSQNVLRHFWGPRMFLFL
jgi:hypothetical protein